MEKQSSLQQDLISSLAFSYCWGSRKHRPIMLNYPWRSFPVLGLWQFSGSGRVEDETGKTFILQKNGLLLTAPNKKYRLTLDDTPELIQRGADLKFTLLGSVDACQFYRIPPIADPKHAARLWPLMEELIALAPAHNDFSSLHDGARWKAAGFRIFAEITSISHPMHQNFSLSENVEKMLPAIRYMQAHFGEKISRKDLARQVHLSQPRFYEIFKKTFGVSPMRYFQHLRISQARKWLIEEPCTIADIAERLAFSDPFHFSRTFKAVCGISPRDYQISQKTTGRQGSGRPAQGETGSPHIG